MDERPVTIPTPDGLHLAGRAAVPTAPTGRAVVCHPHPRMGGTMDNPVVAVAVERAARRRLATLRFDFRGAGASPGRHEDGRGEVTDVRAALALADALAEGAGERVLIGYSFGAAMAAAAVRAGEAVDRLVLVSPPVTLLPIALPPAPPRGLWVVVGDHDGWCPAAAAADLVPRNRLRLVPGADHFYTFTMDPLRAVLDEVLR